MVKEFKEDFKTKNPLKVRRDAVKALVRSQDARGVKELLKVVKTQEKHASKLRKEWAMRRGGLAGEDPRKTRRPVKLRAATATRSVSTAEEDASGWAWPTDRDRQHHAEDDRGEGPDRGPLQAGARGGGLSPATSSSPSPASSTRLEGEEQREGAEGRRLRRASARRTIRSTYFIHMFCVRAVGDQADRRADRLQQRTRAPAVAILALEAWVGRTPRRVSPR